MGVGSREAGGLAHGVVGSARVIAFGASNVAPLASSGPGGPPASRHWTGCSCQPTAVRRTQPARRPDRPHPAPAWPGARRAGPGYCGHRWRWDPPLTAAPPPMVPACEGRRPCAQTRRQRRPSARGPGRAVPPGRRRRPRHAGRPARPAGRPAAAGAGRRGSQTRQEHAGQRAARPGAAAGGGDAADGAGHDGPLRPGRGRQRRLP
jgi:hypothetical protein